MTMEYQSNNRRIVKNTLLLYMRMMFTMGISLFTSRVILNALGVEDYGIYNVIGGLVTMFTVISGSLSNAISRFLTIEIGLNNPQRINKVFSTGVNVHIVLAFIVLLLGELVGGWFLNSQMSIPSERIYAANWVLQFSLLSFCINLINVPYNAAIIAYEKMNVFAYIGIAEVIMKLVIAYLIYIALFDKLIYYSFLMFFVTIILRLIYGWYCNHKIQNCCYTFVYDSILIKEMSSFAGWGMLGTSAYMLNTQGVNMLINIYFGVIVNAARGVAVQVDAAIKQFVNSFTTAINPQITKSYAKGDYDYMLSLMCSSAKFSSYLMLFLAVPLVWESDMVLTLWLKKPPAGSSVFLRLLLLCTFVDNILANPLITAQLATGYMKNYQISVTIVGCLVFPLTWIAYSFGAPVETTYYLYAIVYFVLLFVRLYLIRHYIGFRIGEYINRVLIKILPVYILGFTLPLPIIFALNPSLIRLIITVITSLICSCLIIFTIGLTCKERTLVKYKLMTIKKQL